jgi:hypothetical protein
MINLLSKDTQKRLRSARRNTIWVRYNFILIVVIIGLNIGLAMSFFLNYFDQISASSTYDNAKNRNTQQGENIKTKADAFRNDLEAAKILLDANISYTDAITTISNAIPSGCSIKSMAIDGNIYKSTSKDMDFFCKVNGRSTYDVVSTLITDLERSLVYTKIYVKQTQIDPVDKNLLQINTSLDTQDPSKKIAAAIPGGCQLQTINTSKHKDTDAYIALKCRPSTIDTQKNSKEIASELQDKVDAALKKSCYFDGLRRTNSRFQAYEENYYIAQYIYTFDDISLKAKPAETNPNGEVSCQ